MSDIMTHILARRSIRRFTGESVSRDAVEALLRAAMAAPSATNRRPWEFVVVTEPAPMARLKASLPFGRYAAPAAIVVCGNLRRALPSVARGFWIQDCSAAAQNILLASAGLGLGAVWVGVHPIGVLVLGVRAALRLPRHVVPLGVIYVGHPAEQREPRTQYDSTRVHWQTWSGDDTVRDEVQGPGTARADSRGDQDG